MKELKRKWLVVTNKACKSQVRRQVERILKGVTLQIIHYTYTQPETIAKEHRNPTLVTYAAALQAAAENGQEIKNTTLPRQSKRNCIVLFNALQILNHTQNYHRRNKTIIISKISENNSLSDEKTTTWRDELQETLAGITKLQEEEKRH